MNTKVWKMSALVLTGMIFLTGCGEKLTKLTADEEEQIVNYSAYVIGEFNKDQKKGYTPLDETLIAKYSDKEDQSSSEDQNADTTQEQSTDETQNTDTTQDSEDGSDEIVYGTISDALGLTELKASYKSYDVQATYVEDEAYLLSADTGNTYVVLHITVNNPTNGKLKLDMLSKDIQYTLNINEEKVTAATTMLLNDLGTYSGMISAGKSVKTVLLFQVPKSTAKKIQSLELTVTTDSNEITVNLME